MKKELPKVFHNTITKPIHNNKQIFYGNEERNTKEVSVDDLFEINKVYRTDVKITTHEKTIEKKERTFDKLSKYWYNKAMIWKEESYYETYYEKATSHFRLYQTRGR